MKSVLVIQCGDEKRDGVHRVRDLYLGPFWSTFRARDREASVDLDVFVLSAQFGLKHIDEWRREYNCKLTPERVSVVAVMVRDQVDRIYPRLQGQSIHFVGSALYRRVLEEGGVEVNPIFSKGAGLLGMRSALTRFLRKHGIAKIDLAAIMRSVR